MDTKLSVVLTKSNAHRNSRMQVCDFAIQNKKIKELVKIAFDTTHENHFKAFWALEFVCEKDLSLFTNYVEDFCKILAAVKNDSAARSATKIALFLVESNHNKKEIILSETQEKQLIESSLDRLIQDEKVASKVYAMKTLFILGKKYAWIYKDLKPIISQDAFYHSAAYKASARTILKKI